MNSFPKLIEAHPLINYGSPPSQLTSAYRDAGLSRLVLLRNDENVDAKVRQRPIAARVKLKLFNYDLSRSGDFPHASFSRFARYPLDQICVGSVTMLRKGLQVIIARGIDHTTNAHASRSQKHALLSESWPIEIFVWIWKMKVGEVFSWISFIQLLIWFIVDTTFLQVVSLNSSNWK